MSTRIPVRVAAALAAVALGFAGLLGVPLTTHLSAGTAVFSFGAIAGSVTFLVIAAGLVRPRWWAWLVAAVAAVAGTAAGLLVVRATGCCFYRGFPLGWHHSLDLTNFARQDETMVIVMYMTEYDRAGAVSVGEVAGGGDRMHLLADLAFWFGVVLTIIVVAGLVAGPRGRARQ